MTCKDCVYSPICKLYADFGVTDVPYDENDICKLFKSKIDFVEVVRCKDCVFWDISKKGFGQECACKLHSVDEIFTKYKVPNDFCSEGERRCEE